MACRSPKLSSADMPVCLSVPMASVFQDGDSCGEDADQLDVDLPLLLPQGEMSTCLSVENLSLSPAPVSPSPVCLSGGGRGASLHALQSHKVSGGQRAGGRGDGKSQTNA